MSKYIIIDFASWAKVEAKDVQFQYRGEGENQEEIISGEEWANLDVDDQSDYILEDALKAISVSEDGYYSNIDLTAVEE